MRWKTGGAGASATATAIGATVRTPTPGPPPVPVPIASTDAFRNTKLEVEAHRRHFVRRLCTSVECVVYARNWIVNEDCLRRFI